MPLFEYHCTACNTDSEVLVRGSETPTCPACASSAIERQISVFATYTETNLSCESSCPMGGMSGCAPKGCPSSHL